VTGPDLGHHPIDLDDLAGRQDTFQRDHIVELEVGTLVDAHPELERGRIFGADHPANDLFCHRGRGYQSGATVLCHGTPTIRVFELALTRL
jgi:hypothetical protein